MIRRFLRIGFWTGLIGGIGFALVRLVQSRKGSSHGMPSGDWPIPKRSETPLVEPKMLHGLDLRSPVPETEDGQGADQPASAASTATVPTQPGEVAAAQRGATTSQPGPPPASAASAPASPEPPPAAQPSSPAKLWVDPKGSFCPSSHPVKAKLASGIFHLPGMTAYDRTTPDRCYKDAEGAESDGLRKAKR